MLEYSFIALLYVLGMIQTMAFVHMIVTYEKFKPDPFNVLLVLLFWPLLMVWYTLSFPFVKQKRKP